jgi:hypothetical protein
MLSQSMSTRTVARTASRRSVVARAAATGTKDKIKIGINGEDPTREPTDHPRLTRATFLVARSAPRF